MMYASPEEQTIFGYLSALESTEHGYFGGYLIVTLLGRPLEFHCTAPVRPSRAQEILYGPTLRPYVVGEQICRSLVGASQLEPALILTDQPDSITAQQSCKAPMVLVAPRPKCDNPASIDARWEGDAASGHSCVPMDSKSWSRTFAAFDYEVRHACGCESQRDAIERLLSLLAERVDLAEPFERIHEAIREAQRIGGRTNEEPSQAA